MSITKLKDIITPFKLAFVFCLSALICGELNLENELAGGVIALHAVNGTKRYALLSAVKRFAAFIFAVALCGFIFYFFGFTIKAFFIFITVFVLVCEKFGINEGFSINCVIATHIFASQDISFNFLVNEVLILAISMAIGITFNILSPSNKKRVKNEIARLDEDMKNILILVSDMILNGTRENDAVFDDLFMLSDKVLTGAKENADNSLFHNLSYYIRYAHMRSLQATVLKRISETIPKNGIANEQAEKIASFFTETAASFDEKNNAERLYQKLTRLKEGFRKEPLPQSREEFESRAALFQIVNLMEYFVNIKINFIATLSEDEIETFWKQSNF